MAIAGICMYLFGRALRLRVLAAFFGGVVYMFSGFLIVSVVFTMFLAAVPWLPLLLAIIEVIVRKQEDKGNRSFQPIPYVLAGAGVIGLVVLAGHPELIYYTLIVAGLYTLVRLLVAWRTLARNTTLTDTSSPEPRHTPSPFWRMVRLAAWLLVMAVLGIGLGAVQLIPLVELLPLNFRAGSASLDQVRGWAWPSRHVLTFWLPNIFGSPSHHQWFDLWNRTWMPATANALGEANRTIFWGVKNYVEGGNYLGIATWLLAALALWRAVRDALAGRKLAGANSLLTVHDSVPPLPRPFVTFFFSALAFISLLFAFGTPLYALLYYGVPGWNQLHSPFRWVFPFTLSMAVLAAVGLNGLLADAERQRDKEETKRQRDWETGRLGDWEMGLLSACVWWWRWRAWGRWRRLGLALWRLSRLLPWGSALSMAATWRRWLLPMAACSGGIRPATCWPLV
ncbi:MAG: hypothetical protein IPK16_33160 [Anaerolineales bacterium]|nr:hypothetical protein [Anaerolineales bacterium]